MAAEDILKWGPRREPKALRGVRCGEGVSPGGGVPSLPWEGSGKAAVPRPRKRLNFLISKWCVLVYSVALNLTF